MPWGNGYTYRRTINLNHTMVGSTDQTDFPVLVAGLLSYLATVANGGKVQNASGYDVIFCSDAGGTTPLKWETALYTAATGLVEYWVKVPTVAHLSADTLIYMFYGNAAVTTDQSDEHNAWDSSFGAVYHLKDGTTLDLDDSTSNENDGTNHSGTAGSGVVDGCLALAAASSEYVDIGAAASVEIAGAITLECWAKLSSVAIGSFPRMISNLASPFRGFELLFTDNAVAGYTKNSPYLQVANASGTLNTTSLSVLNLNDGAFHYIVATYDGTNGRLYVDGVLKSTVNFGGSAIAASSQNVNIGRWPATPTGSYLDGLLDEVRISSMARSGDWVVACYNNVQGPLATLGSETLAPATQTITFTAGIPTGIAMGVPTLTGNLVPPGIPSGVAFGTPFINQQQILSPTGIASGLAFGHPLVSRGVTLYPGGIASGFAAGAATIKGPPQTIYPLGIRPGLAGVPTLIGGNQDLDVFVAGVGMFKYNLTRITTVESQTIGRWTAKFTLYDSTYTITPKIGQTCIVMEFGRKLFAGCVSEVIERRAPQRLGQLFYDVTATDKSGLCDHRVITGAKYLAAQDAADVIRDIVAKYLNGEGITTQGVPATLGALGADMPFNFNTVTNGFDQLATLTGTVWWVDVNGVLNFSSFTNLPAAPFSLSDSSSNWRNLSYKRTLIDYRNKEYAISNLNVVPGGSGGGAGAGITETFTMVSGITDPFTSFHFGRQQAAFDHGLADSYIWLQVPVSAILSLKVNGTSYPIYDSNTIPAVLPAHWWAYFAGAEICWPAVWLAEGLSPGDVVVVQYLPVAAAAVQTGVALDPGGIGPLAGTCGSGIYEHVTQTLNLDNQADLNAVAAAELARSGGVPTLLTFETDNPGLAPGQQIVVNIPDIGLVNAKLLITGVKGTSQATDLGHLSSFRWVVTATSNQDPGNWIKWYERLVRRTELPLPVNQYEQATFILGPGGSLSQGTLVGTPDFVGHTGLLFELMIAASVPPIDEDLVVTLVDGGASVISITLPAGTAANFLIDVQVPASPPKYLYAKDVLNVSVKYNVVGPNPTPASGVAFRARWKF